MAVGSGFSPQLAAAAGAGLPFVRSTMSWATVIGTVNANAYNLPVLFLPGTYQANTVQTLASGAYIFGGPGVIINETLPTAPYSPFDAAFSANRTLPGPVTTFTVLASPGNTTITVASVAGLAVNDWIALTPTHLGVNAGLRTRVYQIKAIAGLVITLDRPLRDTFFVGDAVVEVVPPQDIIIQGNGMRMQGSGQRFIQIAMGVRCHVSGVVGVAGAGFGDILYSFDVGSLDCVFENMEADGGNIANATCIAIESGERCSMRQCIARNAPAGVSGFELFDCVNCVVEDCQSTMNGGMGLRFVSDGNEPLGCESCEIRGGDYSRNSSGIWLKTGQDNKLSAVAAHFNAFQGLLIGDGVNSQIGVVVENCEFRSNTAYGIYLDTLLRGVEVSNTILDDNITGCVRTASEIFCENVRGHITTAATAICTFIAGAYVVVFDHCNFRSQTAGINNFQPGAGVFVIFDSCDMQFSSSGIVPDAGSVVRVRATRIRNNGAGINAIFVNGGTCRLGDANDLDAAGTAVFVGAGFVNVADVVSGGVGAAQAIAWPNLMSTDHVDVTRRIDGGVPGLNPLIVKTPGVGFSVTFPAGDTSTYEYRIE